MYSTCGETLRANIQAKELSVGNYHDEIGGVKGKHIHKRAGVNLVLPVLHPKVALYSHK